MKQLKEISQFAFEESKNKSDLGLTPLTINDKLLFLELPKDFLEHNGFYRSVSQKIVDGKYSNHSRSLKSQSIPGFGKAYWYEEL